MSEKVLYKHNTFWVGLQLLQRKKKTVYLLMAAIWFEHAVWWFQLITSSVFGQIFFVSCLKNNYREQICWEVCVKITPGYPVGGCTHACTGRVLTGGGMGPRGANLKVPCWWGHYSLWDVSFSLVFNWHIIHASVITTDPEVEKTLDTVIPLHRDGISVVGKLRPLWPSAMCPALLYFFL